MFNNMADLASMFANQLGAGSALYGTAADAGPGPAPAKKKSKAVNPNWPGLLGGAAGSGAGGFNPMAALMMALMGQGPGK